MEPTTSPHLLEVRRIGSSIWRAGRDMNRIWSWRKNGRRRLVHTIFNPFWLRLLAPWRSGGGRGIAFFWGAIVLIKFWTTTACKFMHAIRSQAWRNPMSHTASLHVDHFHADKACAFSTHVKEIMPAGLCHTACHALIAPLPWGKKHMKKIADHVPKLFSGSFGNRKLLVVNDYGKTCCFSSQLFKLTTVYNHAWTTLNLESQRACAPYIYNSEPDHRDRVCKKQLEKNGRPKPHSDKIYCNKC